MQQKDTPRWVKVACFVYIALVESALSLAAALAIVYAIESTS